MDLYKLKKVYQLSIKGVIHIGAHYGSEIDLYTKLGIDNIIFFEPVKDTFKILSEQVGDRAILINKALGNENKIIEMNVETANQGQSSSILEPNIHLTQYPWITFDKTEMVEMVTLDSELPDATSYNFIIIDVQGYELEVLKGAVETLKNVDYIISEVNNVELYTNGVKVDELDNFLLQFGFVRTETHWETVTWGDALYIKKKNVMLEHCVDFKDDTRTFLNDQSKWCFE